MLAHLWSWFMANCWGNLVASVLWAVPAFVWHHRRLKRHHTEELTKLRKHLLSAIGDERQRQSGGQP